MNKNKIFIILILALFMDKAHACSCDDEAMEIVVANSELIFVGEVKSKSGFNSLLNNKYKFKNINFFKNSEHDVETVIWSPKSSSSCGIKFEPNVSYVVFAYKYKNKLWADHCSSWPVINKYKKNTDEFNAYYKLSSDQAVKPKEP